MPTSFDIKVKYRCLWVDVQMGLRWVFYIKTITENQLCEQILSPGKVTLLLQIIPPLWMSSERASSGLLRSFLVAPLPFVPSNSNKTRNITVQMEKCTYFSFPEALLSKREYSTNCFTTLMHAAPVKKKELTSRCADDPCLSSSLGHHVYECARVSQESCMILYYFS